MKVLAQRRFAAIAALALAIAAAGTAYASIPDGSGVIHGCYATKGGTLRVVDSATSACLKGELPLNWNLQGPPGPAATALWGRVAADGTLQSGSGIEFIKPYTTGGYRVRFVRDVSQCAYSATPAKDLHIGALSDAPDNPNDVLVVVGDGATGVDMDFSVAVHC